MYLNRIQLAGNLGGDPVGKNTQGGKRRVSFSLAVTKKWNDAAGAEQSHTSWFYVVAFGKTGEIAEEKLRKGNNAFVDGELVSREWEENGEKKRIVEVRALMVDKFEKGARHEEGPPPGAPPAYPGDEAPF